MKDEELKILYFIGFILSYTMFKIFVRKENKLNEDWSLIFVNILIGLLSFLGVFLVFLTEYKTIAKKLHINIKPPKWL